MAQIDDLRAAVKALTDANGRLLAHVDALNAHIADLTSHIAAEDAQLADLQARLNAPATPAVEPVDMTDVIKEINDLAAAVDAKVQ